MGKLDEIPKQQIFRLPDDYFEKLPLKIQSRIETATVGKARGEVSRLALQYGLPLLLITTILFFYVRPQPNASSILATVETEDLINYLQNSGELNVDDLLENLDLDSADLEAIEREVYDMALPESEREKIDVELNTL